MNPQTHPIGTRFLYETEAHVIGPESKILVEAAVHEWSPCSQYVRTGNRGSDMTYWRRAPSLHPVCLLAPVPSST